MEIIRRKSKGIRVGVDEDYHPLATFNTEIAKNGAPKSVMIGTTAIAQGQFGKGRIICFSPHLELTEVLDDLVRQAIEHVRKKVIWK